MSGKWTVTVHWTTVVYDGKGDHRRGGEVAMADPPTTFDTERQAQAAAAHIRARRGADVQVLVTGPNQPAGNVRLSDETRTTGLAGIRAARKHLGGQ